MLLKYLTFFAFQTIPNSRCCEALLGRKLQGASREFFSQKFPSP